MEATWDGSTRRQGSDGNTQRVTQMEKCGSEALLRQNSNFATGESFTGVALDVKSVNSVNYVVRREVDSKIRGG